MDPMLTRLVLVLLLVLAVLAVGAWWSRRDGTVRAEQGPFGDDELRALGVEPTGATTLGLLLGSPTCAPCHTVKGLLAQIAEERADFDWVYLDASDHLDLAQRHGVRRVPTLFVVDGAGHLLARTSGVPAKHELVRVLDREGELAA